MSDRTRTGRASLAVALIAIATAAASPPAAHAQTVAADTVQHLVGQLRADVEAMRSCRPARGLPVDVRPLALGDEAAEPAYLLTSIAACECGQVNCSQWIYRRTPQGYAQVLETAGYRLALAKSRHHGLFDIEVEARDSAASVDRLRYAFDGTRYRETAAPADDGGDGLPRTAARRVAFAKGRSGATLEGRLGADIVDRWILGARKGQTLTLSLRSATGVAAFATLTGPAGPAVQRSAAWTGVLPATGDYTIAVEADGGAPLAYRLDVDIGGTKNDPANAVRARGARD